jgi:hypothetical protein
MKCRLLGDRISFIFKDRRASVNTLKGLVCTIIMKGEIQRVVWTLMS